VSNPGDRLNPIAAPAKHNLLETVARGEKIIAGDTGNSYR
jgi:hypothetical protein